MRAICIAGADIVSGGTIVAGGSVIVEEGRIAAIEARAVDGPVGAVRVDGRGLLVVPGFVDLHVHGTLDIDVLDGPGAVAAVAARLPRFGVTAFAPTSLACPPVVLDAFLADVAEARASALPGTAAVLAAHLESNFMSPDWRGAQPLECLCVPPGATPRGEDTVDAQEVLRVIDRWRDAIGAITLAPELVGGLDLVGRLARAGHQVSLGHTAADVDVAREAVARGACRATHLFNRMPPITARAPGVAGLALATPAVVAEVICDGVHVHPSLIRLALAAKGAHGVAAITDGTAASGLPVGRQTRLGGRQIVAGAGVAMLADGTLAGSTATMDAVFHVLVGLVGVSPVTAAELCAGTPARHAGHVDAGELAVGRRADIAVLDEAHRVCQTIVGGVPALEHAPWTSRLST